MKCHVASASLPARLTACVLVLLATAAAAAAQPSSVTQRGFLEGTGLYYPQKNASDDVQWVGQGLFRQEAAWRPAAWLRFSGAFDGRAASDDRVERSWTIDWTDRGLQRPALSVRAANGSITRAGFTFVAGKQFVRWGKADVLNPTDRFAPRDLLEVVDNDFLAVTAARATYERGSDTIDLVWMPVFTPSRVPLAGGRWSGAPSSPPATPLPLVDVGSVFPSRSQAGLRWNHVGSGVEFSLSYFDGFDNFPRIDIAPNPALARTELTRVYSTMRMAGGDAAWPLRWFTLKGEAGFFWTTDLHADDYGIYVIQVERQQGEWLFVGGYAGEVVTADRTTRLFPAAVRVRPRPGRHLPRPRLLHHRFPPERGLRGGHPLRRGRRLDQGRVPHARSGSTGGRPRGRTSWPATRTTSSDATAATPACVSRFDTAIDGCRRQFQRGLACPARSPVLRRPAVRTSGQQCLPVEHDSDRVRLGGMRQRDDELPAVRRRIEVEFCLRVLSASRGRRRAVWRARRSRWRRS